MKTRIGILVLVTACAGLFIALLAIKKQADDRRKKDTDTILDFSNQWVATSAKLDDFRQANLMYSNDLAASRQQILTLSNSIAETSDKVANIETTLKASQIQIANLNGQIADLESENQTLNQRILALTNTIANLSSQIDDTQKKLAAAESDKTFLESELKRLTAERDELQHKFSDLAVIRSQVRKLRDDLAISRRLEWTREGILSTSTKKGAQVLTERTPTNSAFASARLPHYDLNVEVRSDGSVRVIPPPTNAPVLTNPPSR